MTHPFRRERHSRTPTLPQEPPARSLADDATAAYANPAGLTQLVEPEVSIEGRSWRYATTYVAGGQASGTPTGLGPDTEPGIREGVSRTDSISGVSQAVPPLGPARPSKGRCR